MSETQRRLQSVPRFVIILLGTSLSLQLAWHHFLVANQVKIVDLPPPPRIELLRTVSLGDNVTTARLLMLWLQSFDTQAGHYLRYEQLNYQHLRTWLATLLELDPQSQYPLLAASHIYSNVRDPERQRLILEFIYEQFWHDPATRWQWLAHAAIIARHRLKDLPLALEYATAVTQQASSDMPHWAQTMQVFILEEMGELERARVVVGGLLDSGHIHDPNEITFLNSKLLELEAKQQRLKIE